MKSLLIEIGFEFCQTGKCFKVGVISKAHRLATGRIRLMSHSTCYLNAGQPSDLFCHLFKANSVHVFY